jgi:tetratricopeptide (TPR) repeat protein
VNTTQPPAFLPALLGALYQRSATGELSLEQNDGNRRLFWSYGKLAFIQSEAAGEQFGNYLLRQGVLDLPALKDLLAEPADARLGEKVVQWGLLTADQRNEYLAGLYDMILLNALEHPVVAYGWKDGASAVELAGGVPMSMDHRRLVWQSLTCFKTAESIPAWLSGQRGWKWKAMDGLLTSLADLPIDPQQAYALSFLSGEPLTFDTLLGASSLDPVAGARMVLALWAIGGLTLAEGEVPHPIVQKSEPPPPAVKAPQPAASQAITGQVPNLNPAAPVSPAKPAAPKAPPPPPAEDADYQIEIVDEESEASTARTPSAQALQPDSAAASLDALLAPLDLQAPPRPISSGAPNLASLQPAAPGPATEAPGPEDAALRIRKHVAQAKKLQLQERTGDAIQALEQGVRVDPESPDAYSAWLLLGQLRMTNPAWSTRAVEALQNASRLNPKAAEPWAVMGEIYHRKGFKANARGCFKKAIELDPSVPIPPDFSMEDKPAEGEEKPGGGGMLERLKGLIKR